VDFEIAICGDTKGIRANILKRLRVAPFSSDFLGLGFL
jgi:hypothetical protein